MEAQQGGQSGGGGEKNEGNGRNIVFLKVQTNVPGSMCRSFELLEFGAVVLDMRGLAELGSFHTLIRPTDLSCIDRRTIDCNTITRATVADAPAFSVVANDIYTLLHGHNISKFDIRRLGEAFSRIGLQAPQASGVIDTYSLLRKTFGKRAGNDKLATLAHYCGFRKQGLRTISDIHMNINVLKNCATVLFLESNYPNIFRPQMVVPATSTSMPESPTSLSKSYLQNRVSDCNYAEAGVDPQFTFSDQAADPYSISRLPHAQARRRLRFEMDGNFELSNVMDSLKKSRLSLEPEDGKLDSMSKECSGGVFEMQVHSKDVREHEKHVSSRRFQVSTASKLNPVEEDKSNKCRWTQIHEETRVAEVADANSGKVEPCFIYIDDEEGQPPYINEHEQRKYEETSVAEFMDAMSGKVETSLKSLDGEEAQSEDVAMPNKSIVAILENSGNGAERNLPEPFSSPLPKELQDIEASGRTISKAHLCLTTVRSLDVRTNFEGVPFLSASHVSLPSIQVREEPTPYGWSKLVLYYKSFPLHLLEFKIRMMNLSYAFDEKGKPRFTVLIEPSESACNVIRKCEDVVKSMSASDGEVEWLPALKEKSGCWVAHMTIGTKWGKPFSTYTTLFFHSTSNGLEKISLGHVDAPAFANAIPHGSIIDVGFGFNVFNFKNRLKGVKLLAKHITLT